jgi:hypothetical protein
MTIRSASVECWRRSSEIRNCLFVRSFCEERSLSLIKLSWSPRNGSIMRLNRSILKCARFVTARITYVSLAGFRPTSDMIVMSEKLMRNLLNNAAMFLCSCSIPRDDVEMVKTRSFACSRYDLGWLRRYGTSSESPPSSYNHLRE